MTDKADEIAEKLVILATTRLSDDLAILGYDRRALIKSIALALDKFSDARLEEAAQDFDRAADRHLGEVQQELWQQAAKQVRFYKSRRP
jgi:hypothetical protein